MKRGDSPGQWRRLEAEAINIMKARRGAAQDNTGAEEDEADRGGWRRSVTEEEQAEGARGGAGGKEGRKEVDMPAAILSKNVSISKQ